MNLADFRADLPVSRGQWRALAEAALDRLGEPAPADRLEATELLVRFHAAAPAADPTPHLAAVANGRGGPDPGEDKGGEGVYLLAIPEGRAQPEMTVEEIVKTKVRR